MEKLLHSRCIISINTWSFQLLYLTLDGFEIESPISSLVLPLRWRYNAHKQMESWGVSQFNGKIGDVAWNYPSWSFAPFVQANSIRNYAQSKIVPFLTQLWKKILRPHITYIHFRKILYLKYTDDMGISEQLFDTLCQRKLDILVVACLVVILPHHKKNRNAPCDTFQ